MSERLKFVARLIDGEKMTDLCHEFGISRKTGYKLIERFNHEGAAAFQELSRRPHRSPNRTPATVVNLIVDLRKKHPSWGAPKIRDYLSRKYPSARIPVASTIHVLLERHELVRKRRKKSVYKAKGTALSPSLAPNDLWCADFKGQFRLGNQTYCYPLTISDHWSRFLLCVEAQEGTKLQETMRAFEEVFQQYGLPNAIRTDNGVPFASQALLGLTRLSVWWLRLGIRLERIAPGCPQQNGIHERMHLTLKQATTPPPGQNILRQQEIFDDFIHTFNFERPHDGIQKRCPGEIYQKSLRPFPVILGEPDYPDHERVLRVSQCGGLNLGKSNRVFISEALGGQLLGISHKEEGIWGVNFMQHELGYFDEQSLKFTPKENPFQTEEEVEVTNPKVSPMSPE